MHAHVKGRVSVGFMFALFSCFSAGEKSLEFGLEFEFELKIKLDFELDFELVLKRQIVVSVV